MIMPGAKCHLKVQFRSNLYAENRNISFKEHWTFGKKKWAMDQISLVLQNPWEVWPCTLFKIQSISHISHFGLWVLLELLCLRCSPNFITQNIITLQWTGMFHKLPCTVLLFTLNMCLLWIWRTEGENWETEVFTGCILIGQCGFRCSLSCCSSSYSAKSRVHLNDEEIDSSINSTREVGITSALWNHVFAFSLQFLPYWCCTYTDVHNKTGRHVS